MVSNTSAPGLSDADSSEAGNALTPQRANVFTRPASDEYPW